jgi:hypothetical protein
LHGGMSFVYLLEKHVCPNDDTIETGEFVPDIEPIVPARPDNAVSSVQATQFGDCLPAATDSQAGQDRVHALPLQEPDVQGVRADIETGNVPTGDE